ncbi:secretin N-terminal domain-containing protein [Synechococcus sp. RSCCF101]|uniref:secretin N-terminal domain-containing protein n=1 Tax=Synechococcus sp. RSCCF101 TaxID=2511069 RepID=UPI001784A585|nr:secretin N-terminal domain-containing protein [Synechococcus sp. RSCCF101]
MSCRLLRSVLVGGLLVSSASGAPFSPLLAPAQAQSSGSLELKVRRQPDVVEVVLENTGPAPALQQTSSSDSWEARISLEAANALRLGPQQTGLPSEGLKSISLTGSGRDYLLRVESVAGRTLSPPVLSADGQNLVLSFPASPTGLTQTTRLNLNRPGRVPQASYVPPLQPRAVAPPLGDMAVGTMVMRNQGYVSLQGPPVTLNFRNTPVKEAMLSLARVGGYGFVYVDDRADNLRDEEELIRGADGVTRTQTLNEDPRPVTMLFNNESYSTAVNAVLMASRIQAKVQGSTIFAGPQVVAQAGFGPQLSKVYRLNQATPQSAAQYLASLGAEIFVPEQITQTQSTGETTTAGGGGGGGAAGTTVGNVSTETATRTTITTYSSNKGPLLGMTGTVDDRLGTITLVGTPTTVQAAEGYLKQIDLRERQVALSVKILDVSLENTNDIDNSFSLRFGNNLIVNDQGRLLAAFGRNLPANEGSFASAPLETESSSTSSFDESSGSREFSGLNTDTSFNSNDVSDALTATFENGRSLSQSQIEDINNSLSRDTGTSLQEVTRDITITQPDGSTLTETLTEYRIVPTANSSQGFSSSLAQNINEILSSSTGQRVSLARNSSSGNRSDLRGDLSTSRRSASGSRTDSTSSTGVSSRRRNPALNYPDQAFYDFLQAQIVSENTKVLASPTIILSESNEIIRGSGTRV